MSIPDSSVPLPATQKPRYFTNRAGAPVAGVTPPTLRKYVEPDGWLVSEDGKKQFPVYLQETLERWGAERHAGGAK